MHVFKKVPLTIALSGCALVAVGCAERTGYDDVQAAREKVAEEQRKTAEVQKETAEDIAAAERKEAEVRHEALKPVTSNEAVREAEQKTAEVRREGAEAVQETQKKAADAQATLQETEAKFNATKARDAFVADHQAKLTAATKRIEALETRAGNEQGDIKAATQKQADELQAAHKKAKDALDAAEPADLLKWEEHRDHVKQAFDALQAKMDQTA